MGYLIMVFFIFLVVLVVLDIIRSWFTDWKYRTEEYGINADKRIYKNIWEFIWDKY